jgi:hypothetical protein
MPRIQSNISYAYYYLYVLLLLLLHYVLLCASLLICSSQTTFFISVSPTPHAPTVKLGNFVYALEKAHCTNSEVGLVLTGFDLITLQRRNYFPPTFSICSIVPFNRRTTFCVETLKNTKLSERDDGGRTQFSLFQDIIFAATRHSDYARSSIHPFICVYFELKQQGYICRYITQTSRFKKILLHSLQKC